MDKLRRYLRSVTSKKHHIEFITAMLSVPVLLTVLILNLTNISGNKKAEPTPKQPQIIVSLPPQKDDDQRIIPTKQACTPGIGDVTITSPDEGETVEDNPLNFTIRYNPGEYCAVVWSYRINGGAWSEYDDKSIALYDLPNGTIRFDLRVKSVVSGGGEASLSRRITYTGGSAPTNTPTPTMQPVVVSPTTTP